MKLPGHHTDDEPPAISTRFAARLDLTDVDDRFKQAMQEMGITPEEANRTICDPLWRIRNLYKIKNKQGELVDFQPNWVQEQLLTELFVNGCRRLLVLKSRKHGVSTLFEIIIFDFCYFGENIAAAIVDLTHGAACDKLTDIARFCWENLPEEIRERLEADSKNELGFAAGSVIKAGKTARGTQLQIIHISEWGPIAHEDPERSSEIKTGALPSADEGVQFIESTFKGGKGGDFYELIVRTMSTPEAERTAKDFRFFFFAWWQDDRNVLDGDINWIPKSVRKYLAKLEGKIDRKLSDRQKVWYYKTSQEQGIFMTREYPSTVEEAFNAPVEGAIYGEIMTTIMSVGHIVEKLSYDPSSPAFTCWDLGWDDSMTVWIWQMVGRDVVFLFEYTKRHQTAAQMWYEVEQTNIPISGNLVPHDGASKSAGSNGKNFTDHLQAAGASNIIVVPRVRDIWDGIDATRNLLARSWFNSETCKYGIDALNAYHTKDKTANGVTSRDPVHDWSSHPCSAVRVVAEGLELSLVKPDMARKVLQVPRDPDGNVITDSSVDLSHVRQTSSMFRRKGLAKSGTRRQ